MFTDIEGSTRLWEHAPEGMQPALGAHDAVVRGVIEAHGGFIFSTGGDGFAAPSPAPGPASPPPVLTVVTAGVITGWSIEWLAQVLATLARS